MSQHCGYVVKIEELHPHSNADRLQIAIIFSQSVIVGLDTKIGDLGVFFPTDLQLSEEYCRENDLVRRRDESGAPAGGYLDPGKRNIRAMKLRGERSEGLFMPLESLAYTGATKFSVGDTIDVLNGHEICRKYIPRGQKRSNPRSGNKGRKKTVPIAPLFKEHVDTEQLVYNLGDFRPGNLIEITLKMHGTSQRTGYLPKLTGYSSKFSLWNNLLKLDYNKLNPMVKRFYDQALSHATPQYDWGYVTGTRRVVLNSFDGNDGFYGGNKFREVSAKAFEGKLWKGETVYYEVVGFTDTGTPIMGEVANSKISDKEFTKKYGKTTTFSYGCDPHGKGNIVDLGNSLFPQEAPQNDFYVYRMTMTNEDGDVVEYTPDFMRYRCEQMGVKCVQVFKRFIIPEPDENGQFPAFNGDCVFSTAGEYVKDIAEQFYDGPDPVGKTHVREGVVVRIVNRPRFTAYKHKNFSFKCLEGIAKDLAATPDIEEAQDLIEEETNES